MMDFKDTIYKIRKELHMTQEQFANEFNVSKQAVQKWEQGTSYPEMQKLIEISRRFCPSSCGTGSAEISTLRCLLHRRASSIL